MSEVRTENIVAKLPTGRNTLLLSASMAALYGMVQLSVALSTVIFVAVTGVSGLSGLGPAIFLATAAVAAFPMGRAMDRFGLVLFVGSIIDRIGRTLALTGGLLLLGLSVLAVVWTVDSVALTSLALFGIGLGWNFSFVAATAELVDLTSPVERGKILGLNDLLSGLLGATLALLGGVVLAAVGLVSLSVAGLVLTVVPVLLILKHSPKALRSA